MLRPILIAAAPALAIVVAPPAGAQLCDGASVSIASDGRVFGHLPYGDARPHELVAASPGFGIGRECFIRRDMLPDLARLIDAAHRASPAIGSLRGLSCHRSIARQSAVFCAARAESSAASRAISVAPPGHSEHATGYAIDFAVRPSPNCPDAEACMAATPAFRWLFANAARYGFEMSFPVGSRQNVKWEPWHWRWVGSDARVPGAARARYIFARARRDFPASPAVTVPVIIRVSAQPPVPVIAAPIEPKGKKRKRRR